MSESPSAFLCHLWWAGAVFWCVGALSLVVNVDIYRRMLTTDDEPSLFPAHMWAAMGLVAMPGGFWSGPSAHLVSWIVPKCVDASVWLVLSAALDWGVPLAMRRWYRHRGSLRPGMEDYPLGPPTLGDLRDLVRAFAGRRPMPDRPEGSGDGDQPAATGR